LYKLLAQKGGRITEGRRTPVPNHGTRFKI